MRPHTSLTALRALRALRTTARRRWHQRDERGDVPGWVLVTVMTLSIGMALWGIAQPQLVGLLESALATVR